MIDPGRLSTSVLSTRCVIAGEEAAIDSSSLFGLQGVASLTDSTEFTQAARALAATAAFQDSAVAEAAGYVNTEELVATPDGVMGIHFVNFALAMDTELDPASPEILLYVPTEAGFRLVGLEYSLAIGPPGAAVPESPPQAPMLFGREFDGPMPGHGPNDPPHYDMHVWLWADNPSGLFAEFNPALIP